MVVRSMVANRRAPIDRDRSPLNVLRFLGAEKQRERSNVGGFAQPTQAVFGRGLLFQFFYRFSRCFRSLLQQLIETLGLGRAVVDDINIHAITLPELRKRFGKIAYSSIDGSANRKVGPRGACSATPNI